MTMNSQCLIGVYLTHIHIRHTLYCCVFITDWKSLPLKILKVRPAYSCRGLTTLMSFIVETKNWRHLSRATVFGPLFQLKAELDEENSQKTKT